MVADVPPGPYLVSVTITTGQVSNVQITAVQEFTVDAVAPTTTAVAKSTLATLATSPVTTAPSSTAVVTISATVTTTKAELITTSTVLTSRSTITETYPTTMTEVLTKTSPVTQIGIVNTLFLSVSGSGVLILIALAVLVPVTYVVGRRKRKLISHAKKETYVEFLAKLEELRSRGDISEETYHKLKEEYWKKFGK